MSRERYGPCSRCRGTGALWLKVFNLGTRVWEEHYSVCPQIGCHRGVVDRDAYYIAMGVRPCNCDVNEHESHLEMDEQARLAERLRQSV